MCRLLGILAECSMPFVTCLRSAPRSLASVSHQHPDGWGAAVLGASGAWSIQKRARCAGEDDLFTNVAATVQGVALVAHVRARTVGAVSTANTHPFQSGRWVFAHNGTVEDVEFLRSRTSPMRQRGCEGETDSELLFAFLLTRLDQRGCTEEQGSETTDVTIATAACELARAGSLSFVLTDGMTLYAHRLGRPLYFLDRSASPSVPAAHLFASEPITGEAWTPLSDRTLLRCRRGERLDTQFLAGWDPRTIPTSDVELPFTD